MNVEFVMDCDPYSLAFHSNRQHVSSDECMEDEREEYEMFSDTLCTAGVHSMHTPMSSF